MNRIIKIILVVLPLFLLVGCSAKPDQTPKIVIPTPGPDTGVVTGRMTSPNKEVPIPTNIYLSKNITEGRKDVPPVISFSYQSNPRGVINEDGNFYFYEVPAGTYAITIWTPPNQTKFVTNESEQDYLWVVVEAGKVTELGDIKIPK